ncbi:MAG: hypothetical protein KAQ94_09390 [Arcobacteraceae bacterium]|nr:hypothetical protein [Arcobacteraceae bacterium]
MRYIYIKNYMELTPKKKKNFLLFVNKCNDFKVVSQKIIFSEESLLLEFLSDHDTKRAYINFQDFFQNMTNIKVDFVEKIFNSNQMILIFNETNKRIRV